MTCVDDYSKRPLIAILIAITSCVAYSESKLRRSSDFPLRTCLFRSSISLVVPSPFVPSPFVPFPFVRSFITSSLITHISHLSWVKQNPRLQNPPRSPALNLLRNKMDAHPQMPHKTCSPSSRNTSHSRSYRACEPD